jgi:hypothetical protein
MNTYPNSISYGSTFTLSTSVGRENLCLLPFLSLIQVAGLALFIENFIHKMENKFIIYGH